MISIQEQDWPAEYIAAGLGILAATIYRVQTASFP
jgi:hypothetical protein